MIAGTSRSGSPAAASPRAATQALDPLTHRRRYGDSSRTVQRGGVPRRREIALVGHDHTPAFGRGFEQRTVGGVERPRSIEDDEYDVRDVTGRHRPGNALDFDRIDRPRMDARGIDEGHRDAIDVDCFGHQIARGSGRVGDDRAPLSGEAVEQARLARVRPAREHHVHSFADEPSARRRAEQRVQLADDAPDLARSVARLDEVISLVWKVERRFQANGQVEEHAVDARDLGRERTFELIVGRASLQRRDGVNQVAHGFRLHEIDAPVEKCAQRELAGRGQPCALRHRRLDDRAKQYRASVTADLDDVLAGVGVRPGKEGEDDLIGGAEQPRQT